MNCIDLRHFASIPVSSGLNPALHQRLDAAFIRAQSSFVSGHNFSAADPTGPVSRHDFSGADRKRFVSRRDFSAADRQALFQGHDFRVANGKGFVSGHDFSRAENGPVSIEL
jgi:hypothetical protein